jgi:uncharacterized coiled-coil protein SlyX
MSSCGRYRQEMGETEHITVAETSDGPGGTETTGETVSLPVVELLTGRGFVTGKSGSGKSNSASVIAEKLLDSGFGLCIVDIDGEYYGLKEEYEILHAGGDEECDIQVTSDHAEKLASLALEQNVPLILDMSSYLDESEAEALLTAVAQSLFAKAKKQKQPFLLLVEEVHEYIPEQGSVGECGKMLIKIGKRGRKHGLGICGISQRPADVKKDFITQCDWLLWHRLTWNNDTTVVRRILDSEYASAVEDLEDGEGFLVTDWSDAVRRVQFYRKQTFDAGATPGLDDVERPDLKSVNGDLVAELQAISDEADAREDRIAELEAKLERRDERIAELEADLEEAQNLRELADQFVDALTDRADDIDTPARRESSTAQADGSPDDRTDPEWRDTATTAPIAEETADGTAESAGADAPGQSTDVTAPEQSTGAETPEQSADTSGTDRPDEITGDQFGDDSTGDQFGDEPADATADDGPARTVGDEWLAAGFTDTSDHDTDDTPDFPVSADDTPSSDRTAKADDTSWTDSAESQSTAETTEGDDEGFSAEKILARLRDLPDRQHEDSEHAGHTAREEIELTIHSDAEFVGDSEQADDSGVAHDDGQAGENEDDPVLPDEEPLAVRELKADLGGLETRPRKMLVFYREHGPATALNAHFAAGGDGDRVRAYAYNRTLRTQGLVEHVGRGRYDTRLRERLAEELGDHVDDDVVDAYLAELEEQVLDE